MNNIKNLKRQLELAQLTLLREVKAKWSGKFSNFKEVKKFIKKLEDIDIYEPWIRHPFRDIYGEELKRKEWEEYILSGVCGKQMKDYHTKDGYLRYSVIGDDFFHDRDINRGAKFNLINILLELLDDWESENEVIPVLTSRTRSNYLTGDERKTGLLYEIRIPALQAATDIVKWCLDNECTGYIFDW